MREKEKKSCENITSNARWVDELLDQHLRLVPDLRRARQADLGLVRTPGVVFVIPQDVDPSAARVLQLPDLGATLA